MNIARFIIIMVCLSALAGYAASGQTTNKIAGAINFANLPVGRVLDVYKGYAKTQLVIATDVRRATHNITLRAAYVSPEEARGIIEHALLKQAGVIVTRLDGQRVSVTYNDKLELKQ